MIFIREHPRELRFFYFSFFLLAGVSCGLLTNMNTSILDAFLFSLFVFLFAGIKMPRHFGWLLSLFIFCFGMAHGGNRFERTPQLVHSHQVAFAGIVVGHPVNSGQTKKFPVSLQWISDESLNGLTNQKILIKVRNCKRSILIRDTISGRGKIMSIRPNKNPNTFNPEKYYRSKNIRYQVSSSDNEIHLAPFYGFHLHHLSHRVSRKMGTRIDRIFGQTPAAAFLKAIFLGNKEGLTRDIKETFSKTGAAHILAVSGLHVGIIYGLFVLLIGSPAKGNAWGRFVKCSCMVIAIWFYAFLTGLSPSVHRAACMLTVYLVGRGARLHTAGLNVIGFVFFIMVIIQPWTVLQVGFQFSFAAVTGILIFFNPIKNIFSIPWKWLEKIWAMCAVTLSAQVFIFPLCSYYFNQFPATFLISSLLAIPASMILLGGTLATYCISFIWFELSTWTGMMLSSVYKYLYQILAVLETWQPEGWSRIYLDNLQTLVLLAALIFLIFFLAYRKKWILFLTGIAFFIFHFLVRSDQADKWSATKFSVYHTYNGAVASIQSGPEMTFLKNSEYPLTHKYLIKPQCIASRVKRYRVFGLDKNIDATGHFKKVQGHLFWRANHIVFDDPGLEMIPVLSQKYPVDLVVISNEYDGALNRLTLKKDAIAILCASLPPWEKEKIILDCKKLGISHYDIAISGAYEQPEKSNQ